MLVLMSIVRHVFNRHRGFTNPAYAIEQDRLTILRQKRVRLRQFGVASQQIVGIFVDMIGQQPRHFDRLPFNDGIVVNYIALMVVTANSRDAMHRISTIRVGIL